MFAIVGQPNLVAKVYHRDHLPDRQKEAKLQFMVRQADAELSSYSAWPQDTLHDKRYGPLVGFLMPNVSTCVPIHMLYGPAHRKQRFPKVAWDFLLFAARNTAAAFKAIHKRGHALGDVNQGNVLVGIDSKVVLIDADSFQIDANGARYLCSVGVAHFTPPELQGRASFDRVARSANHDNFGLALLVFHLLFGGRHPFAGVPHQADVGEALERDIQAFRYAYAPDAVARGLSPPPRSIPLEIVPDVIRSMFISAFTEQGARERRPTAEQWVSVLDGLRGDLTRCASSRMHIYPKHCSSCPWCELETKAVFYFVDLAPIAKTKSTGKFDLAKVWAQIQAVAPPPNQAIPAPAAFNVQPEPVPAHANFGVLIFLTRVVLTALAIGLAAMSPKWWLFYGIGLLFGLFVAGRIGAGARQQERYKRQAARNTARYHYDGLLRKFNAEATSAVFQSKLEQLSALRIELEQLPTREQKELADLQATARSRQLTNFLGGQFIEGAQIAGIGPAKKAALASFGVETAADIIWDRIINERGFGEVLTKALVNWRKSCERRFVFDASSSAIEKDRAAVRQANQARKHDIEAKLQRAPDELQRQRDLILRNASLLAPSLQAAAQALAQAEADLSVLS